MRTQKNELALLREAAEVAGMRHIPDAEDSLGLLVLLTEMAERVNEGLDAAESAVIATAIADEVYATVPVQLLGERIVRYRHYTLYVDGERLAHWVRLENHGRD